MRALVPEPIVKKKQKTIDFSRGRRGLTVDYYLRARVAPIDSDRLASPRVEVTMTSNQNQGGRASSPVHPAQPAVSHGSPVIGRFEALNEQSSLIVRNPTADASPARSNSEARTSKVGG
jgi:hypothetical protein